MTSDHICLRLPWDWKYDGHPESPPDVERALLTEASAQGLSPDEFLSQMVISRIAAAHDPVLTAVLVPEDGVPVLRTAEPTRVLNELTAEALAQGRELEGLSVRRPTLEDIYLLLTAEDEA